MGELRGPEDGFSVASSKRGGVEPGYSGFTVVIAQAGGFLGVQSLPRAPAARNRRWRAAEGERESQQRDAQPTGTE